MRKLTKTSTVSEYLEKIYNYLNVDFFNGELEQPIITIMSTPKAYGHVTTTKIWESTEKKQHELNIAAGTLNRPIENVVATMLHEMVHIYNLQNGIQDTSRGNTYHNMKFKTKAEEMGLVINHNKKYGWSVTEPSEKLIEYVRKNDWQEIPITRKERNLIQGKGGEPKKKKSSSTRKYLCPKCGISCRATKDILIICGTCSEIMVKTD